MNEDDDFSIDPITLLPMDNAVTTSCGHSFSESSIKDWLEKNQSCPLCNTKINASMLIPNYSLREAIIQLKNKSIDISSSPQLLSNSNNDNSNSSNNNSSNDIIINNNNSSISSISNNNNNNKESIEPDLPKTTYVREIIEREAKEGATLIVDSTSNEVFMNFFFGNVYYRTSGGIWYCHAMIEYALKRARVWGIFQNNSNKMLGIMICQPPNETGISIYQMIKSGMLAAPLHMGVKPLAKVLRTYEFTEKVHQQHTRGKLHWYINCITVHPSKQKSGYGKELISTVLRLADSQRVHCYTECDKASLDFFTSLDFYIVKYYEHEFYPNFYVLMRAPQERL
ncbi:hypothetical protein CYY_003798 [Polysphondylium violaceum]|uniref:U-box domain-containing protein n=1 Tax=Polysphondylium violaceum TaxID=133409 RepID=A0A8J4V8C0_9MYCE|nr:hypothetical protein CYY_003798 [Polysphondylium violaceum]